MFVKLITIFKRMMCSYVCNLVALCPVCKDSPAAWTVWQSSNDQPIALCQRHTEANLIPAKYNLRQLHIMDLGWWLAQTVRGWFSQLPLAHRCLSPKRRLHTLVVYIVSSPFALVMTPVGSSLRDCSVLSVSTASRIEINKGFFLKSSS